MARRNKVKAPQQVKKVVDINQATHMAMPMQVFNALTGLIGKEIPWGVADQTMTLVKQAVAPVELVVEDVETETPETSTAEG